LKKIHIKIKGKMGRLFFLTACLAFVVERGSEVVALPDSVWGPRSEGFSSGSEDGNINSGSSSNKK